MKTALDITESEAVIVHDILRRHLPDGARAFAFGSRAHGRARRYSDLDLAVEWQKPLGLDLIATMNEAFSESDLPFKVDILDLAIVDAAFRRRIMADALPIATGSA